jgi:hypothetical protein
VRSIICILMRLGIVYSVNGSGAGAEVAGCWLAYRGGTHGAYGAGVANMHGCDFPRLDQDNRAYFRLFAPDVKRLQVDVSASGMIC